MVSGSDSECNKTTATQPPTYGSCDEEVPKVQEGLYVLTNKMARTVLDLPNAEAGKRCHAYRKIGNEFMGHQLWIIQQNGLDEAFTLKNFQHNTVLDLLAGSFLNKSYAIGRPRTLGEDSRLNQEWYIAQGVPRQYTIQYARTKTLLALSKEDSPNDTHLVCLEETKERDYQFWDLERVSRSNLEVKSIFGRWKPELLARVLQPYEDDAQYFVLSHELRQSIWEKTNLCTQKLHQHMFDYDDFVLKAKEAVRAWAKDRFSNATRGYSVLFGTVYGGAIRGPRAYNWYLTPDMSDLVFFDAQTGREYTPTAIDGFGFGPTFLTF